MWGLGPSKMLSVGAVCRGMFPARHRRELTSPAEITRAKRPPAQSGISIEFGSFSDDVSRQIPPEQFLLLKTVREKTGWEGNSICILGHLSNYKWNSRRARLAGRQSPNKLGKKFHVCWTLLLANSSSLRWPRQAKIDNKEFNFKIKFKYLDVRAVLIEKKDDCTV